MSDSINVLFVDDEPLILKSLNRSLQNEPYVKHFASSASEALEIMGRFGIAVLVTDMKMPEVNGLMLLKEVKTLYPDTVRIVLSGYTSLPQVLATVNQGDVFRFISKPWEERDFKEAVSEAVDYYRYKMEIKRVRTSLEKKNATFENIVQMYDHKLLEMKAEVELLHKMSLDAGKDLLRQVLVWDPQSAKSVLAKEMKAMLDQYWALSGSMPFIEKRFSLKQLLSDVQEKIDNEGYSTHVEYGVDIHSPSLVKGNITLLEWAIKLLLHGLIVNDLDASVSVFASVAKDESAPQLRIVLSADRQWLKPDAVRSASEAMLKHAAQHMGGAFVIKDLGKKVAVIFSGACQL